MRTAVVQSAIARVTRITPWIHHLTVRAKIFCDISGSATVDAFRALLQPRCQLGLVRAVDTIPQAVRGVGKLDC